MVLNRKQRRTLLSKHRKGKAKVSPKEWLALTKMSKRNTDAKAKSDDSTDKQTSDSKDDK